MPEEPDVSPADEEILDRIHRSRVAAKKRLLPTVSQQFAMAIANRILHALRANPNGLEWVQIREMFEIDVSDQQIRHVLLSLQKRTLKTEVNPDGERFGERWLLAS